MIDSLYLSETLRLPFDEDLLMTGDRAAFRDYMRNLVQALEAMYSAIAISFNRSPEYVSQDSQPTPAEGSVMVWKDADAGSGQPVAYLVYNDSGTVYTFASQETVP